jgi:hypothetical protein
MSLSLKISHYIPEHPRLEYRQIEANTEEIKGNIQEPVTKSTSSTGRI